MRRFPALESRWRFWSPDEASIGAVPFHEAKWARLVDRGMSPMLPIRRAAREGTMPVRSISPGALIVVPPELSVTHPHPRPTSGHTLLLDVRIPAWTAVQHRQACAPAKVSTPRRRDHSRAGEPA